MYNSKYYTCEQIDQRLLEGYYDDAVSAGYTGSKAQYLSELLRAINYSANPTLTADKVVYNQAISGLTTKNVQAAIDELANKKFDKASVVQSTGESEYKVMSQKATTTAITDETTRAKAAEEAIVFDVSVYNNGAVFESLKALLSSSNLNILIPTSARRGGMAIRFIQGSEQSSDNKYVQYRLMAQNFTTDTTQWQGVDNEPTAGSQNLATSGGVANGLGNLNLLTGLELKESPKDLAVGSIYNGVVDANIKNCLYDNNYIKVLPNLFLGIVKATDILVRITQYDENKTYISQGGEYYSDITSVITQQNTKFIRISAYYINRGFSNENPITIDDYQEGDFGILIPQSDKIDDEPTAGSDNLVKSGGVANKLAELESTVGFYFDGNGDKYVGKNISCLVPNHKYTLFLNYRTWKHEAADAMFDKTVYAFHFGYNKKDGTHTDIVKKTVSDYNSIKSSYNFTVGSDTDGVLFFGGRADIGETINLTLIDITDTQKLFNNQFDIYEYQKRLEKYENLSPNIICIETALDNSDIDANGNIKAYDRRVSDYIYCKGETYISGTYKASRVGFYDKYRKFISVASEESGVVEVPSTAYYARIVFSHYTNNDYFIFGNNPNLTKDDYVPYGSEYLKNYTDNAASAATTKIEESINNYHRNEYAYNVFDVSSKEKEHSSIKDRLYINIPANTPFKLNINCDVFNGNLLSAAYIYYSDGTTDFVKVPFSNTEYIHLVKNKDITSIGFYILNNFVSGRVFSSVTIIKEDNDINNIPSYWLNYLPAKIEDIHINDEDTSFNGDMFIFFTDYHIEQNSGISHKLIKYITDRTNVDKVIFGGDAYNGGETREIALEKLRIFKERFASLNVIGIRGNHEYNLNDGGSPEEILTESEIFANISDKYKKTGVIRPSKDVMYGYLDNDKIKLRYIFLDSKYESSNHELIDDIQLDWMASKMSELDSSWTILIFSHQFRMENGDYMPSGQKIADKISQTDYSATLAAIIYGHSHKDFYHDDLGYLDICTTCDSRQEDESWNQGSGTTDEHAFDVFAINLQKRTIKAVRIGRHGEDTGREWTY